MSMPYRSVSTPRTRRRSLPRSRTLLPHTAASIWKIFLLRAALRLRRDLKRYSIFLYSTTTSTALPSLCLPALSTVCVLQARKKEDCRVVVNGAGSAGVAITKLLLTYGFRHVTMCDREGIIGKDYPNLNWMQQKMTEVTNLEDQHGTLADALKGADIFCGCLRTEHRYPRKWLLP